MVYYSRHKFEVRTTAIFDKGFESLRNRIAQRRVQVRIRRLSLGNPGQHRVLTGGVVEMKIDFGPGYRVYYTVRAQTVVILLCGGDKSSQTADVMRALALAREL